jgi:hypothetical protein
VFGVKDQRERWGGENMEGGTLQQVQATATKLLQLLQLHKFSSFHTFHAASRQIILITLQFLLISYCDKLCIGNLPNVIYFNDNCVTSWDKHNAILHSQ